MAAIPRIEQNRPTLEEAAEELYRLLESCFDHQGISETERDARYDALSKSLDAKDVGRARSGS